MVLINVHVSDDKEKYEPVLSPLMATSYVSYNPKQAFWLGILQFSSHMDTSIGEMVHLPRLCKQQVQFMSRQPAK